MGRKYGQHFLSDSRILERIAQAAHLRPREPVLEVGPGQGALTRLLLASQARVAAVEIDQSLYPELERAFGGMENFTLVRGDILATPLEPQALFGGPAPYAVVANLPYYLSSPILFHFLAHRQAISRCVLMVQKEVAQRMAAGPGDGKTYGSLSIALQYAFGVEYLFKVAPGAFSPPPKVDSAVVRLTPLDPALHPPLPPALEKAYLGWVKLLFTKRRKVMAATLKGYEGGGGPKALEAALAQYGRQRPEELAPPEHLALFKRLEGV